jgi:phage tail sheath gpL-like
MSVSFNHIPSGLRVPLFYAEVDNSMANTATSDLKTLLIAPMTSGKAEANIPVLVSTDSMGKELFGRGSVLARMNTIYRENDSVGEVWAIPLVDSDAMTAASGSFTVEGEADASGTLCAYVGADRIQVGVQAEDSASAIASALADAINAQTDLPVTAEASAPAEAVSEDGSEVEQPAKAVVTLNAKNKGLIGNDIQLGINLQGYAAGEDLPEGVSVTVSAMAGGTGTPDLSGIAKAMGDEEYDFIALPYSDVTSLDVLKEIMNESTGRWSYVSQLYGHVYSAKRGSLAELQAFGSQRNNQHETVVGVEEAVPSASFEVLAAYVARNAAAIEIDPARPTQTLELEGITSAPKESRFIMSERNTLLSNGIATQNTQSGYMRVERAITTYQKNSFGDADNSYRDSETLHTLAYIIRQLRSCITSKYPRHKLADDGTRFGAGQAVVTPSIIRGEIIAMYQKLEEKAIVENADLFAKYLIVERDADDPNRVNVLLPPDIVNQLRIFAVLNQFRLQY